MEDPALIPELEPGKTKNAAPDSEAASEGYPLFRSSERIKPYGGYICCD